MLGGLIKEASGILDRRFLLNAFLPVAAFLLGALALVAQVEIGLTEALHRWDAQSGGIKTFQAVAFIVVTALFAMVLGGQESAIIRLFEGYWPRAADRTAGAIGRSWHRRRLLRLAARDRAGDDVAYQLIYFRYPLPTQAERVMPSRLGNILRNAESYPRDRYDIDAVLVWPRLWHSLPDSLTAALIAARADVGLLLGICLMSGGFAVLGGGYVVLGGGGPLLLLGVLWGGSALAWLTYTAALRTAVTYGTQVKVAFDVYRHDLRAQLTGEPRTEDQSAPAAPGASNEAIEEEAAYWRGLGALWYRAAPAAYPEPPPAAPSPSPPPPPKFAVSLSLLYGALVLAAGLILQAVV